MKLHSPVDLVVAADCAGTTLDVIKKLNPELRRWCTPPDAQEYTLRIPEGTKQAFLEKLSYLPDNERFTITRYKVAKGDTFKKISRKTGIPTAVILSLNSMEKIMPLKTGSTLYLPPKEMFRMDPDDKALVKRASFVKRTPLKSHKRKSLKKHRIRKAKRT